MPALSQKNLRKQEICQQSKLSVLSKPAQLYKFTVKFNVKMEEI